MVLIIGTPKMVPLILGNPHLGSKLLGFPELAGCNFKLYFLRDGVHEFREQIFNSKFRSYG